MGDFKKVPKDVIRECLFPYLDGPAACAVVSTCKYMKKMFNRKEIIKMRLRKKDWNMRRVQLIQKFDWEDFCTRCEKMIKEGDEGYEYNLCSTCDNIPPKLISYKEYFCCTPLYKHSPWIYMDYATLNCDICTIEFETNENVWQNYYKSCMKCGIFCNDCLIEKEI